jgi:acetyl-CoA acetyltransferase
MEGLGLIGRGEAGEFARAGHTSPGGKLPTNTNGGLLSEGYLHGMNTVTEAVWQIEGLCGERQVPKTDVVAVCSGGMSSGSAIVLTKDR